MSGELPNWTFPFCPAPPDWTLDWEGIQARFAWIRDMAGVPQDPIHHAEGDVLIHTRMVAESLAGLHEWRSLTPTVRACLFAAALLHDVAKPATTQIEPDGSITSRGHARKGEMVARTLLWHGDQLETPPPFACREAIAKLVRYHGLPLWVFDKPSPERAVIEASQTARLDWTALLAEADARGRHCGDRQELLDRIELFRLFCREQNCYDRPKAFASDHSRFLYFRSDHLHPDYAAYDDTECEVVLMAGVPGAGKDTWVRQHRAGWNVISLDDLRRAKRIRPEDNQGPVIHAAREQALTYLRQRQSFVWNATNITRQIRRSLADLFLPYHPRILMVYLDAPFDLLLRRNRARAESVPEPVLRRLISRVEVPDRTEAHTVQWEAIK